MNRAALWAVLSVTLAFAACGDSEPTKTGGTVVWLENIQGTDAQQLRLAVDKNDNLYIATLNLGQAEFGSGPMGQDMVLGLVIAKYNPTMSHLWAVEFTGTFVDQRLGLGVDGDGSAIFTVRYDGDVDFGDGNVTGGNGTLPGGAIVKLNGNTGELMWARRWNDATHVYNVHDLAVNVENDIALATSRQEAFTPGGMPLAQLGAEELWVALLDTTDGSRTWQTFAGDPTGSARANRIGVDRTVIGGAVYITGEFTGTLDLGTMNPLTAPTSETLRFYGKLGGTDGLGQWAHALSLGDGGAIPVTVDEVGDPVLAANFELDTSNIMPPPTTTQYELQVTRHHPDDGFDGEGGTAPLWRVRYGSAAETDVVAPEDVTVDSANNAVVSGIFGGTLDLDGVRLSSPDAPGAYIVKLAPADGNLTWARQTGGTADVKVYDVESDRNGDIVLAGTFEEIDPDQTDPLAEKANEIFLIKLAD